MQMQPNLPNLKPGDLVAGRFRIVEMVGSGGFSVVYRAHQETIKRFVALKVLKPRAAADIRVVERFRREALYASQLTHPNTIKLFDYGQTDDGLFYIAMEFLSGMDLSVLVQRGDPMPLERVWRVLAQASRSLAEAHRLGLVHRDLKPENIFLVQREEGGELIKVLDFGVSKAISTFGSAGPTTMAPLTQEGTVFGTPLYMAPEQAMAEAISPAVDVYAMGHIAFEMVTGRAAYWDCTNPMDVMLKQVNDPPLALPKPWDKTPFSQLITRCTQKNPKRRIQDASKLLEELMKEEFAQHMDPADRPQAPRSPVSMMLQSVNGPGQESEPKIEQVYRWEFESLLEALEEVKQKREMRLVVIRGAPGTGRSNLLRAFLRRAGADATVIHRQTAQGVPMGAGLEADLAMAAGVDLLSPGFEELRRLVMSLHEDGQRAEGMDAEDALHANPLSQLAQMRDTFLAHIATPFRTRAEQGALVWGLENLERCDTLTLSFLDRFFMDLQAHPAPVLIVVTVHTDELERRSSLMRYTERLMGAGKPFARQLNLLAPGERKPGDAVPVRTAEFPPEVGGSYHGTTPLEQLAARGVVHSGPVAPLGGAGESGATEMMGGPFDQVLGYMAQLGDEVPYALWRTVSERLLDERLRRASALILDQAEKFGIVQRTSDRVMFSRWGYASSLREAFDKLPDAVGAHDILADLLRDHYPIPTRDQVQTIVQHLEACGRDGEAVLMLLDAGQRAFRALDFDAARELYLHAQKLLERLLQAAKPLDDIDPARVWLRLGEVHGALYEYGAAEDALQRAIRDSEAHAHDVRGRAHKLLGDMNMDQGRFTVALTAFEEAQRHFREAGLASAYVAVTGEMGYCALMQGQTGLAEELLGQALEHAHQLKEPRLVARLHQYMGQVLTRRARFLEAIEQLETSMALFEQQNREAELIACLEDLGTAAFAASQYERSRDYHTRAAARAATSRIIGRRSPHLGLARACAALGNMTQAEAHLAEALAVCETVREPFQTAEVHLHLGDLYLAMQQEKQASRHYDKVIELAKSIGHTRLWLDALVRQSYVSFDRNDMPNMYDMLTRAVEMAQAIGDRDAELQVRTHIIYFQLLEHDFEVKGDTFSSILNMGKKMRLARTPVLCWLFRADVSLVRGFLEQARDELKQAYMGAAQLGDYAMFILIARRDYALRKKLGQLGDAHVGAGQALGALVPPEVGKRRLGD
jgi:serine/threonine protein kinase/tetratricopeptide (TPR) repeat protein